MSEVWKPVVGFEGRYEVSDLGRVRSLDHLTLMKNRWGTTTMRKSLGRVMSAYEKAARGGYRYVNLHMDGQQQMCRVAGLVAAAFIGPRPDGAQVCHRNGVATDDRATNLRYGTPASNNADKRVHGTHLCGGRHPAARITEADVRRIRACSDSAEELAAVYSVHPGHINNIRRGVRWAHV